MSNEFPRRNRVDQFTPAEKAIWDAQAAIEEAGAHPRLTDALNHLLDARQAVADFVDRTTTTPRKCPMTDSTQPPLPRYYLVPMYECIVQRVSEALNGNTPEAERIAEVIMADWKAANRHPAPAATTQGVGPRCSECGEWCESCQNGKNRIDAPSLGGSMGDRGEGT